MGRVIVAGSANMDVVAVTDRHPRPGETVVGRDLRYSPGGKGANQAVAASRSGADVVMVGAVGDDASGQELVTFLASVGVDTTRIAVRTGLPTGTALVVVSADGDNSIVVVPGANASVDEEVVATVDVTAGDVLVAQHETPIEATAAFFASGRHAGARCILNPAPAQPLPESVLDLVDILVLNQSELATLTGHDHTSVLDDLGVTAAVDELRARGFEGCTVVTLGAQGVLTLDGTQTVRTPGRTVDALDTTGAGDCFVGSLAAELARDAALGAALTFANAAAALSVQRPGAGPAMPDRVDVERVLADD